MKDYKKANILLVDDHYIMRKTVKDMLKSQGFENFLQASGGDEAFEIVKKESGSKKSVDIIITDWEMPEGSGLELVKMIKTSPDHFKIPIIMLTDSKENLSLSQAKVYGLDDYLVKPFGSIELSQLVSAFISIYFCPTEQDENYFNANSVFLNENYDEAFKMFVTIYNNDPSARVAYLISVCLEKSENLEKAEKLLLKHNEASSNLITEQLYKIHKADDSKWEKLIKIIEMLIEQNAENRSELLLELGNLYLKKKKDLFTAYEKFKKAWQIDKKNVKIAELVKDLEDKFPILTSSGKEDEELINKGLKYANDLRLKVKKLKHKNSLDKYIEELQTKLEYLPGSSETLFELGLALLENSEIDEAKKMLEQAMKTNSDSYNMKEIQSFIKSL